MAWTAADWSTTPVSGKAKMAQDILGQDRLQQLLIDADRDAARCVELQRKQNAGSSRSAADGAEQASVLSVQEQAELRRLRRRIWELAEVFGPTCDLWCAPRVSI
eukprot:gnl/TRDRNA2_/TRDRNA2_170425_c1_seq4.p1 gnl/TRDRNA2_/TRDRNA2_170425_c1~~gnl/TRDRNA2_/TRDRNA2_170425_c1_seq4.p1  ORF type:complete len:105 (+),score=23.71 gnl/TRDRNA2_/TRDRNA2_170425_c1_seq4:119-433(+)